MLSGHPASYIEETRKGSRVAPSTPKKVLCCANFGPDLGVYLPAEDVPWVRGSEDSPWFWVRGSGVHCLQRFPGYGEGFSAVEPVSRLRLSQLVRSSLLSANSGSPVGGRLPGVPRVSNPLLGFPFGDSWPGPRLTGHPVHPKIDLRCIHQTSRLQVVGPRHANASRAQPPWIPKRASAGYSSWGRTSEIVPGQ